MFEVTLKPLLLALAAVALVLVNGVFVAAEFAIVRVRRTRLEELVGQGVEKAKDAILVVLVKAFSFLPALILGPIVELLRL
jgi:CBS domain containing-hemolysin-like protein